MNTTMSSHIRELYEELHGNQGDICHAGGQTVLIFPDGLVRDVDGWWIDTVDG